MKLLELLLGHIRWCVKHHIHSALILGERYDLPDCLFASQDHKQPVDARCNSTVRWSAVFKRLKRIRYEGMVLPVISYQDLLGCKKNSTRMKDLADVDMLVKTREKKKNLRK